MKYWKPAGRLMRFDALDRNGGAFPSYVVAWRIEDEPDVWTDRALKFKEFKKGYAKAGACVMRDAVAEVLALHDIPPNQATLCTALKSSGTGADPSSILYKTGAFIAKALGVNWQPDLFTKTPHRSLRSISGAAARDAEVENVYTAAPLAVPSTLIVLDDFITRGATLNDMNRALQQANPRTPMIAVALAKNETAHFGRACGRAVDNTHVSADWEALWQASFEK